MATTSSSRTRKKQGAPDDLAATIDQARLTTEAAILEMRRLSSAERERQTIEYEQPEPSGLSEYEIHDEPSSRLSLDTTPNESDHRRREFRRRRVDEEVGDAQRKLETQLTGLLTLIEAMDARAKKSQRTQQLAMDQMAERAMTDQVAARRTARRQFATGTMLGLPVGLFGSWVAHLLGW